MKKNRSLFILLPLVALIWAMIIYRVYKSVNSDNMVYDQPVIHKKEAVFKKQSFSLRADYRDPFLGNIVVRKPVTEKQIKKTPVIKKEIVWPKISYGGAIKGNKTETYILNIDNKGVLFQKNETIQGISLKKVFRDSVEVEYEKTRKMIRKN